MTPAEEAEVRAKLPAATLELLLRLDGLTSRLENAVLVLEQSIGDADDE